MKWEMGASLLKSAVFLPLHGIRKKVEGFSNNPGFRVERKKDFSPDAIAIWLQIRLCCNTPTRGAHIGKR